MMCGGGDRGSDQRRVRTQLDLERLRFALELAARADPVGARPAQRRRVGVDRDGRFAAPVQDPMDRYRCHRERRPRPELT